MCCLLSDSSATEIYTLSLHDALPISLEIVDWPTAKASLTPVLLVASFGEMGVQPHAVTGGEVRAVAHQAVGHRRSEEHTSELQSLRHLVCRLLLEKKKKPKHKCKKLL